MTDGNTHGRWAGGIMLVLGALAVVQAFALAILAVVGAAFSEGFFHGSGSDVRLQFFVYPFSAFGLVALLSAVAAALLVWGATRAFDDPTEPVCLLGAAFGLLVFPPLGTVAAVVALVLLVTAEPIAPSAPSGAAARSPPASGSASSGARGPASPPPEETLRDQDRAPSAPADPSSRTARVPAAATAHLARDALEIGAVFQGRYEVAEHLGTGGMGRTFLATDRVIERDVVLKELLPHLRADERHLNAFLREARVAGGMDHPHIVRLYDVVRSDDDDVVLVLEHVDGGSLADRLPADGMPLKEAVPTLVQLLDALDALHDRGIWHRDVKPHNVLVTGDGRVKLADFGIAHVPGGETLVTSSQPGTVKTMAPEQITGGDVDGRADLYAVTALLYEMLTGDSYLDFDGLTLYQAQRAVVEEPPKLPVDGLPDDVNAFLEKGLAKKATERFQTANEMRRALEGLGA